MCRILTVGGPEYGRLGFSGFDTPTVVVPGRNLPVLAEDGSRFTAKWGFPHHYHSGNLVFNARAESVYACVKHGIGFWSRIELGYVPLLGFKEGGRWFALYDDKCPDPLYAMAVFDVNKKRVALVTTVAYSPVRQFHNRQLYVTTQPTFPDKFEDFFELPLAPLSVVSGW